jgi:hypothetical protein
MSNRNTNTNAAPYALNIMVLDLETTGLDPVRHDVLEIGAVLADGTAFYARVKSKCQWSEPKALEVNGIPLDNLWKGMTPRDAWYRLSAWAMDWIDGQSNIPVHPVMPQWHIAGKNPSFDIGFLSQQQNYYAFPLDYSRRGLDLHTMVAVVPLSKTAYIPPEHDAWYRRLGIDEEPRPHHALRGALHEHIALRVLYGLPAPQSYIDAVNAIDYMALRDLEEPFIFNK